MGLERISRVRCDNDICQVTDEGLEATSAYEAEELAKDAGWQQKGTSWFCPVCRGEDLSRSVKSKGVRWATELLLDERLRLRLRR